jgi:hypothetical protein
MRILALTVAAAAALVFATNVHAQGPRAKKAAEAVEAVMKPILNRKEQSSGHP